jgi:DNA-directed RNA polymerase specialized sigma24 family protein
VRIWESYWSPRARASFSGRASISGLVVTVALRVAVERLRAAEAEPLPPYGLPDPAGPAHSRTSGTARLDFRGLENLPGPGTLGTLLGRDGRLADLQAALMSLSAQQAIFSNCYHVIGLRNNRIAGIFQCSEANVTQVLQRAWKQLILHPRLLDALESLA